MPFRRDPPKRPERLQSYTCGIADRTVLVPRQREAARKAHYVYLIVSDFRRFRGYLESAHRLRHVRVGIGQGI